MDAQSEVGAACGRSYVEGGRSQLHTNRSTQKYARSSGKTGARCVEAGV